MLPLPHTPTCSHGIILAGFLSLMSSPTAAAGATDSQTYPPPKAVIFDLDGTLLDTEALSDQAIIQALKLWLPTEIVHERQSQGRLPWDIKKQILGKRGDEWVPITVSYAQTHWNLRTNNGDESLPSTQELWTSWEESLNDLCEHVLALPGAYDLIAGLSARNVPMAIATSSRSTAVAKKRKRHEEGIFQHMSTIVAGDNVQHGKPAPDIYLEAAKRLSFDPSECVVFEDAVSGMRSGKAAGCTVVAVPDPRMERDTFEEHADIILKSLVDFDFAKFGL